MTGIPSLRALPRIMLAVLFIAGIVGLFVGPVVLAVAYTLLAGWVKEGDAEREESDAVQLK